jgi:nucleotide-binding universal stress UspA family protein
MVFLKKILVPTDLSEFSLAAMEYAQSFGELYTSRIYVLHVVETKEGHQRKEDEAAQALKRFVEANVAEPAGIHQVVRNGIPWVEIRRFADEEGIDMIVIATHGRTGFRHVLMGSVAEKVVRLASVPVLAVKPQPVRESLLHRADIEQELHLR